MEKMREALAAFEATKKATVKKAPAKKARVFCLGLYPEKETLLAVMIRQGVSMNKVVYKK